MAAPAIVEPIIQKTDSDCVIVAVAMILGLPYAEVTKAALNVYPDCLKKGLTTRQMMAVVRSLKRSLESVPIEKADLSTETGILDVRLKKRRTGHAVVLFEGVLFNPADGLLYNLETYLHVRNAKPLRFFRP